MKETYTKDIGLKFLVLVIFIGLSTTYYFIPLKIENSSQIFLTIATFLFAILTGFFISRQGSRYSSIRDQITKFDGEMSSIFRQFGHLGLNAQTKAKKIIKDHYTKIINNKSWDYHFIHKSNTLTFFHQLSESVAKDKPLPSLKHLALQRVLTALESLQVVRKKMIALHNERIPIFQWILIYFLAIILLIAVSVIPSQQFLLGAILKGAFGSTIIFILILLYKFDKLKFFEGTMGEKSAQDILDIFEGKK